MGIESDVGQLEDMLEILTERVSTLEASRGPYAFHFEHGSPPCAECEKLQEDLDDARNDVITMQLALNKQKENNKCHQKRIVHLQNELYKRDSNQITDYEFHCK